METGEAHERSPAEAWDEAVKVNTSKGITTKEGASVASAKHAARWQRIRMMLTSSESRRASGKRHGGHQGPRGFWGYMRGETFEGKEAQGRYRHETRLDGRLRNNASRGCETPRAPRSWEGMPSARTSGTRVTFGRRSLRLQSKRRRARKLQEGEQHEVRPSDGNGGNGAAATQRRDERQARLAWSRSETRLNNTSRKTPNVRART